MEMNNHTKRLIAVVGIAFVLFSLISFVIPFEKNGVFWLSYLFGSIAILSQIYIMGLSFGQGGNLKSKVYGMPIAKLGMMYAVAQVLLSSLFMKISMIVPVSVVVVTSGILMGGVAIGVLVTEGVREEIIRQDTKVAVETSVMKTLQNQVATLVPICPSNLQKPMEKLVEEFKYSDPMSGASTQGIENQLFTLLGQLSGELRGGDEALCTATIGQVSATLAQRNALCKANK